MADLLGSLPAVRDGEAGAADRSRRGSVDSAELRGRLAELIARHGVPGASLAVLAGGQVATAAAGVLNVATDVAATDDALFQIGSITKVYTASLVMQLVEEGRVQLDAPVVTYLPELKLADAEVAEAVTLRHLLTHTSGIEGDHFPDLGRGDDVVKRYVASCAKLGQTHPLGATMSYCNSGFVIAGRVIEKLTGQIWDDALASRLIRPLDLGHSVTLPEEVLRFRGAIGHVERDGQVEQVPTWGLPRSCGPAGLICATAADVVAFARMHLDAGRAAGGEQVLSRESVTAMQDAQVAVPDPYTFGSHWGLGWMLFDCDGRRVYGHDGGTLGQSAFLRVVPDADVAVALLANGGHTVDLFDDLVRPLLDELAGFTLPIRLEPPAVAVDGALERYVGVYERLGNRIEIELRDGRLVGRLIVTGPLAEMTLEPVTEIDLVAVRTDVFVTRQQGTRAWTPVLFYRLDDGSSYVHLAGRATPKVS
jgi:CubicO group peptidase (beta-lactamase class C family)